MLQLTQYHRGLRSFEIPFDSKVTGQLNRFRSAIAKGHYRKGPLSQKSAGHMQNHKTKTNT